VEAPGEHRRHVQVRDVVVGSRVDEVGVRGVRYVGGVTHIARLPGRPQSMLMNPDRGALVSYGRTQAMQFTMKN
jgi:hypothetical protein